VQLSSTLPPLSSLPLFLCRPPTAPPKDPKSHTGADLGLSLLGCRRLRFFGGKRTRQRRSIRREKYGEFASLLLLLHDEFLLSEHSRLTLSATSGLTVFPSAWAMPFSEQRTRRKRSFEGLQFHLTTSVNSSSRTS